MKRKATPVHPRQVEGLPEAQGGLFRVAEDGRVYRKKNDGWVLAPQCKTSRDRRYLTVSAMVEAKQKRFYVHRLVAEAYIPNPEGKPTVNHIDGFPSNNHASNLEWVTQKENVQKAYKNGQMSCLATTGRPCISCGKRTLSRDRVCVACRLRSKQEQARQDRLLEEEAGWEALLENVDMDILTVRQVDMIAKRIRGMTLQEIGDIYGVTRERVRQILSQTVIELKQQVGSGKRKALLSRVEQLGITKAWLTRETGLSPHIVTKILNKVRAMKHEEYTKIREALERNGVTIENRAS